MRLPITIFSILSVLAFAEEGITPEKLYRQTVETWQRKRSRRSSKAWDVWKEYAGTLGSQYQQVIDKHSEGSGTDIIGAIEEGILTIERIVFQQQEGPRNASDDAERDATLAIMYTEYGRLLLHASEPPPPLSSATHRCFELANDPHTLLIGAPERLKEYQDKKATATNQRELIEILFGPLCKDNAENALRNALSLDANREDAEKLLEEITGLNSKDSVHVRKPKEFVAELFDAFADTFDNKLTNTLNYRVPQIIGSTVKEIIEKKGSSWVVRNVLDAGCGTGLAGRELRKAIDGTSDERITLVGVDASRKMLDIAEKCTDSKGCGLPAGEDSTNDNGEFKLYDALLDLDLEEMTLENTALKRKDAAFDLIVAADVFVYFGSLERILQVFSGLHNRNGGLLVFTCERATSEEAPHGFRLLPTGRFSHTKEHVVDAASTAGYTLIDYNEIVPRTEKGLAVDGHMFVLEKNGDNEVASNAEL